VVLTFVGRDELDLLLELGLGLGLGFGLRSPNFYG
jgi:hypothetical protein